MSEPSSTTPGTAGTPKQPVSAARNLIGIVVLFAVVIVGWFEYSAKAGYNSAVAKLNTRSADEEKDLMSETEAEELMGDKKPDNIGNEVHEGAATYTKKSYTWSGLFRHYTITAYYTKAKAGPALHHFETDEEKYKAETNAAPPVNQVAGGPGENAPAKGARKGKSDPLAHAEPPKPTKAEDKKAEPAKTDDKKPEPAKTDKKAEPAKTDDKKADAAKTDKKADAPAKTDDKKPDQSGE